MGGALSAPGRLGIIHKGELNQQNSEDCLTSGLWVFVRSWEPVAMGVAKHSLHCCLTLSVNLSEHDILRPDNGDDVGEHVALAHKVQSLEMGETRRLDLAAVRLVGAVRDEVDAELALRRLHGRVRLAGGDCGNRTAWSAKHNFRVGNRGSVCEEILGAHRGSPP